MYLLGNSTIWRLIPCLHDYSTRHNLCHIMIKKPSGETGNCALGKRQNLITTQNRIINIIRSCPILKYTILSYTRYYCCYSTVVVIMDPQKYEIDILAHLCFFHSLS
ncbi:unnamed protein product [Chrysodeixis includens]|uniref:Uncharacterized protein n=1 Tax=Chrysodeixis includens TaxID=689277 RepID=A0A9P0C2U7_CHRIL|nr:unnamed protein product [Chrysodeixis includens]